MLELGITFIFKSVHAQNKGKVCTCAGGTWAGINTPTIVSMKYSCNIVLVNSSR